MPRVVSILWGFSSEGGEQGRKGVGVPGVGRGICPQGVQSSHATTVWAQLSLPQLRFFLLQATGCEERT